MRGRALPDILPMAALLRRAGLPKMATTTEKMGTRWEHRARTVREIRVGSQYSGLPTCRLLTQYETQTAVLAPSGPDVPRKFQDAHVARRTGISAGSL